MSITTTSAMDADSLARLSANARLCFTDAAHDMICDLADAIDGLLVERQRLIDIILRSDLGNEYVAQRALNHTKAVR